ncbi:hypothetical protein ACP70R_036047 [Stipagrostis hirtigluma subsp. patula]
MAPVILETEVHCVGCARKIRKAVENLHGVEGVWASPETGLVVVNGPVDAAALRWRIETKMRRAVTIVSDGAPPPPPPPPPPPGYPPYVGMAHLAPPHYGIPPPAPAYPHRTRWHGNPPTISWTRRTSRARHYSPDDDAFHHHARHYVPSDDDACYARHHHY